MHKSYLVIIFSGLVIFFSSCQKEKTEFFKTEPSRGDTVVLQGLSGSELTVSTNAEVGENAMRSVFLDLSKEVQTPVLRDSWDLGFYCGTSDYRVIINHSRGATATALDKTDWLSVNVADSVALKGAGTLDPGKGFQYTDAVAGDLTTYLAGTVFGDVSTNSKVVILNPGNAGIYKNVSTTTNGVTTTVVKQAEPVWKKVKVVRTATGYTLTQGGIAAQAFTPVQIVKDKEFNFKFFSFTSGVVAVEPAKELWDIEWTYSTYKTTAATPLPVAVPDFVLINFVGGVTAAEIKYASAEAAEAAYRAFSETDLTGVVFLAQRDVIGTNWRTINTSGTSTVNKDRLYVIKDTKNNVYVLRFNRFSRTDGATRGRPEIAYKRIQNGES